MRDKETEVRKPANPDRMRMFGFIIPGMMGANRRICHGYEWEHFLSELPKTTKVCGFATEEQLDRLKNEGRE